MPNTHQEFSDWARTYHVRIQPTQVSIWQRNDGFLWKAAVLLGLACLVWGNSYSVASQNDREAKAKAAFSSMPAGVEPILGEPRRSKKSKAAAAKPSPEPAMAVTGTAKAKAVSGDDKGSTYIRRFAPIAVSEMKKYGIPASIILAQGLIESNSGSSGLAQKANNHFGIKCFSKHCRKGHCMNYSDDSHKDFFVKYNNAWSSFRAHSEFLKKAQRYHHLFKSNNYRTWANGLERAGYATDRRYAEKLIGIIERYNLYQFDTNN